jgi:hypothetical protein
MKDVALRFSTFMYSMRKFRHIFTSSFKIMLRHSTLRTVSQWDGSLFFIYYVFLCFCRLVHRNLIYFCLFLSFLVCFPALPYIALCSKNSQTSPGHSSRTKNMLLQHTSSYYCSLVTSPAGQSFVSSALWSSDPKVMSSCMLRVPADVHFLLSMNGVKLVNRIYLQFWILCEVFSYF